MARNTTTSQTVGPYFSIGLSPLYRSELPSDDVSGERITIRGRVLDGDGRPVPDAVLEFWQADSAGHYPSSEQSASSEQPSFWGFGRVPTNDLGQFEFRTIKPGRVPAPDGTLQAPHIVVSVFMRGLLTRLITRIYFAGEPHNDSDFILNLVEPSRRKALIATPSVDAADRFEWNVVLQGLNETAFLDF